MITKIKTIINATNAEQHTHAFVKQLGELILQYSKLEHLLTDDYFHSKSFETLLDENHEIFKEITETHYETSYANPDFAVKTFGKELGQLLCAIYTDYRKMITFAYRHQVDAISIYSEGFLHLAAILTNETTPYQKLKAAYEAFKKKSLQIDSMRMLTVHSPLHAYPEKAIKEQDLDDLRYLFKYGVHITDNEIKTAQFLASYDPVELEELMNITADAYVKGFETDGKDITLRHNVSVVYNVGQEKMIQVLIEAFKKRNLKGYHGNIFTTSPNRQYEYDHRFDNALYLSESFKEHNIKIVADILSDNETILKDYSGIMYFDKFGEKPFVPQSKDHALKLDETQSKISQSLKNKTRVMAEDYLKGTETSFCIIAFPVPDIGEQFEAIYADTCRINKLSSEEYLPIQQVIIDALDLAEYVHVKGSNGNKTDIKVMHKPLSNPEKETNYYNCGADVNIPVGEVFTSPVLKGTNGLLHLDVVYLNDLKFIDLELIFKDGYVDTYTCKNFDSEKENKKFIEENLLFPHKSLPLGEFAIGTNTLAYVIAEKYDIVDILPVLIVEKMGPHFAIGDTCYTYSEDLDVFNPNGKCIVARDNEHSIIRKEDMSKAYTNVHTDITLPYDSLAFINAVTTEGKTISIIKDGRFVLEGTEILNEPFNQKSL